MAFNLKPFGNIIESLMYNDKISVLRLTESTDQYGATIPDSREEVYADIPAKFSFSSVDGAADANEVNIPILKKVIVHVSLDYEIFAGDVISGYRKDSDSGIEQLIEGICGQPNRFETHQEIPLEIKDTN